MPIVNPTEEMPKEHVPVPVRIASPKYKGVTVDTRYIPTTALLTHIEGSSWTVDYYSQVLNDDSATAGQNVDRHAIYQQYTLIKGMELKVTTALTTTQVADSKAMPMSGVANVYPFLIPNEGDMFLAVVGDGRTAIFQITSSERKSIFTDTCYTIEYQLIDYLTIERRADIDSKVVKTVQFVMDFLQYGQNPLLVEEDFALLNKLKRNYHGLMDWYFNTFTNQEFKTLIVPGQPMPVYDHFLAKTVTSFFTTYDTPQLRNIKLLNCDGDNIMLLPTIWDVLAKRSTMLMKAINRRIGLVPARSFTQDPMLEGIYHSGITYVVYPTDPITNNDFQMQWEAKCLADASLLDSPAPIKQLKDLITQHHLRETAGVQVPVNKTPLIKRANENSFYVFSRAFYEGETKEMSVLELCVFDYLEHKAFNNHRLHALSEAAMSWGTLERFYYVPIVLMLIKTAIRSINM